MLDPGLEAAEHLGVLERADLVVVRTEGRVKYATLERARFGASLDR